MDIVIGETDDPVMLLLVQPPRSFRIILSLPYVGIAVNLNNQLRFSAEKIHYEPTDRMLPAEMGTAQLSVAKTLPELLLRRCHFAPQLSRTGLDDF
jgi:hypothetical protein